MKGNVFQMWLKEFCALVFTQTIQAFILAIILVLIMMIYNNGTFSKTDQTNATGVLAIIALTSISKMEGLVKKMFGVESSLTDTSMNGGKGGVLGTVMAMKMAKKALDNIPKTVGGVKGIAGGIADKRKAKIAMYNATEKQIARYNKLHPGDSSSTETSQTSGTGANQSSSTTTSMLPGNGGANGNGAGGPGSGGYGAGGGAGTGGINGGTVTITNSNVNVPGGNNNVNGGSGTSGKDKEKSLKDQWALEDSLAKIKEEYNNKKAAANEKIRDSGLNIARGVTETAGGFLGGATGAVVAAGMGTDILKGVGTGIGVGDMIGQKAVDLPYGAVSNYMGAVNGISDYIVGGNTLKTLQNDINKQLVNPEYRANAKFLQEALKKAKITAGDI